MHLEAMLKRNLTHAHNSKVLLFFVHAHKKCFEFIPNDDDDDGKEEDEKNNQDYSCL